MSAAKVKARRKAHDLSGDLFAESGGEGRTPPPPAAGGTAPPRAPDLPTLAEFASRAYLNYAMSVV
jgi:hypothetical protein